jgi:hypothetical protein
MKGSIFVALDLAVSDVRRLLRVGIDAGILNGLYAVEFNAPLAEKLYVGWEDVSESERRILQREGRVPTPQRDVDYPVSEGGSVVFSTMKGTVINKATRWRLSLPSIEDGLKLMSAHHPQRFAESLLGTPSTVADVKTGVILLQLSLFHKLPDELEWRY